MKVLITRAYPAANQTAKNLEKSGHEAILVPLFEIIDTENPIPDLEYDGYIFTSKNALEVLKTRGWKPTGFHATAFCVGTKTEQAASQLGFANIHTASGGGAALATLIADMDLKEKRLLYCSTPDRSFEMSDALKPSGINVDTIDIYQAMPINPDLQSFKSAVKAVNNGYIFAYSALSAQHLAQTLETINLTGILNDCTLVGISKQAVKPLEHIEWKGILIAEKPDEAQMISLIS